ncbi:hypothetical protein QUF72_10880 [Desulfobacterales bacterium HSG2]|nr:hypothetical protein [Desulfobacterales bacterium HSG2]
MLGYDTYLNRYLFALRVNSSLVWFPNFPSVELSLILGNAIADRLPTIQARPWYKTLSSWDDYLKPFGGKISSIGSKKGKRRVSRRKGKKGKNKKQPSFPRTEVPETSWPIETVLFFYPGKRTYGQGELIFWELKLIGESADHGLFLEVILPALEDLGHRPDSRWQYPNCLWGRFDIQSVYMARGSRWEPVAENGKLNLDYKARPVQWSRGLNFEAYRQMFGSLNWLTPFDFRTREGRDEAPTLKCILEAFTDRMALLMLGKHYDFNKFCDILNTEDQSSLVDAIDTGARIPILRHNFKPAPKYWPGRWTGTQTFATPIPDSILPYLGLASIFHIGRHTHFGCGTFIIKG